MYNKHKKEDFYLFLKQAVVGVEATDFYLCQSQLLLHRLLVLQQLLVLLHLILQIIRDLKQSSFITNIATQ